MTTLEAEAFEVWQAIISTRDEPGHVLELLAHMLAWTAFAGTGDSGSDDIDTVIDSVAKLAKVYAEKTLHEYLDEKGAKGELQ